MKLIIAGSRDLNVSNAFIEEVLKQYKIVPSQIISGTARGIDRCGESYAKEKEIDLDLVPANWELHGKSAGPKRNRVMAFRANALLLIWDGESRGSANMRQEALNKNLYIIEIIIKAG